MKGLDMGWDAPSGLWEVGDGYLGRWPRLSWVAPLAPGEGGCVGRGWRGRVGLLANGVGLRRILRMRGCADVRMCGCAAARGGRDTPALGKALEFRDERT